MACLSNTELSKFRDGHYRWERFRDKLLKQEPFVLTDKACRNLGLVSSSLQPVGGQVFLSLLDDSIVSGHFEALSGAKFETVAGNIIGLTQLAKTEEFGRSSGCSSGSEATEYLEYSITKIAALATGLKFRSNLTPGIVGCPDVDFRQWNLLGTAQCILDSKLGEPGKRENWTLHYKSLFVARIHEAYRRVRKGTSFAKLEFNKWNPADFWAANYSQEGEISDFYDKLDDCQSLAELKDLCFNDRVFGISLKKGGTKLTLVEPGKELPRVSGWKGRGGLQGTGKKTLKVDVFFKNSETKHLIFRPAGTSIKVEVQEKGSNHREGGTGSLNINKCLQKAGIPCYINLVATMKYLKNLSPQYAAMNRDDLITAAAGVMLDKLWARIVEHSIQASNIFFPELIKICTSRSEGACPHWKIS